MIETKKTIIFAAVAVVLLIIALIASPKKITPEAFSDQGQKFFPEFTNPNDATTLEVVDFDEATGSAHPFKVTFKDGKWIIPSHNNYPADAKDRLAKTAAGVIDIKKDEFRTNNVSDQEICGVVDPLDETAGLSGRGQRVTIKGKNDVVLADLIIGKPVEGKKGFHYVRVPGQNRIYAVKMDVDISTNFEDWINRDLLELSKDKIEKVVFKDYSINERTLSVDNRGEFILKRKGNRWVANRFAKGRKIDSTKMDNLLKAVVGLNIVDVRPKPTGLSANLKKNESQQKISQADILSLQNKGFYFTRDGQLLSNEGELEIHTNEGVVYTLRFGEVVFGSGLNANESKTAKDKEAKAAENRYLFISAKFDSHYFKEPPKPKNTDYKKKADSLWTDRDKKNKAVGDKHDQWEKNVAKGKKISTDLNNRFADWYYIISSDSYDKIHLKPTSLIAKK